MERGPGTNQPTTLNNPSNILLLLMLLGYFISCCLGLRRLRCRYHIIIFALPGAWEDRSSQKGWASHNSTGSSVNETTVVSEEIFLKFQNFQNGKHSDRQWHSSLVVTRLKESAQEACWCRMPTHTITRKPACSAHGWLSALLCVLLHTRQNRRDDDERPSSAIRIPSVHAMS